MGRARLGAVVGMAVVLGGCWGPSELGGARVGLEGDVSTAGSVVAVMASNPSEGGTACSGVAIGPSAVVTSAFCVIAYSASDVLVYPNGLEGGAASGIAVTELRIDPWDPGVGAGSYRLAVLHTGTPHGAPVAARASAPPAVDDAVTIVGFGETIATPNVFGETRREADVTVSSLQATPDSTIPSFETLPATNCDGDGGGGVFAADGALLGVIQGGPDVCRGATEGDDNIIEISAHADFIDDALLPSDDAGAGDAGSDAGGDDAGSDAGADDGGSDDAGSDVDSGVAPGMGDDGGCGCRTTPYPQGRAPFYLTVLALLGVLSLRRRRG